MDGYEDMFKEITRKLYGEEVEAAEYDDLAAALAAGGGGGIANAGTSAATAPGGGAASWVHSEEALPWSCSKVAAYSPQQKLFRCVECADCVGVLARVAEHWVAAHGAGAGAGAAGWATRCVRLDDVSRFLQRLRARADSSSAAAAAAAARASGVVGGAAHAHQQHKRYCCGYCPYATDRRDLFTRHENIHREEKPFQCYVCHKQFNRADHVKKHFLRMHRDFPYDLNRIRRTPAARGGGTSYHHPRPPPPPPQQQHYATTTTTASPHVTRKGRGGGGKGEKRYSCCYCPWAGADNWCLKRHLNTHLKPFACALCEYKAARAERLSTHVLKVHNKRACPRCAFLADDAAHLTKHLAHAHPWEQRNGGALSSPALSDSSAMGAGRVKVEPGRRQHCGAERLFHYLEASDDDDDDEGRRREAHHHHHLQQEEAPPPPAHLCLRCGCEFLDAVSLETHALTHPAPEVRRPRPRGGRPPPAYRCAVCGGGRATRAAMLAHLRSHLRGRRSTRPWGRQRRWGGGLVLRCPACPRRLRSAASLALHRAWRHAAPAFPCEHCPRSFRRRYQVVLHASREHVTAAPKAASPAAAAPPPILNVPRVPSL